MQLDRPGAVINYEVWPSHELEEENPRRPWITLVNGHTRPLNDFRMLGKSLVEAGLLVLALDNRGAGKTEVSRAFTLDEMAGDVAALWDELGIDTSALMGVSMGGFIAQRLAHQHPDKVAKLILVSTAGTSDMIGRERDRWSNDPKAAEQQLLPYFTEEFAQRNAMLVRSMAKQIATGVSEGGFAEKGALQIAAVRGFNHLPWLKDLKMPALVIHGDDDRIIPAQAAETLARHLPHARLELLQRSGHLLLAERPRELYALVREFATA